MAVSRRAILSGVTLALIFGAGLAWVAMRGDEGAGRVAGAPEAADWVAALAEDPAEGFAPPVGPFALSLPQDHGPHDWARSDLWHLTAHLTDDQGRPVGVQFLLLRLALSPEAEADAPLWQTRDIYRAHAVLAGGPLPEPLAEERFARGIAGLAGPDPDLPGLRLDHWHLALGQADGPALDSLTTGAGPARVALQLTPDPARLIAADGEAGLRGYALSRLPVEGVLEGPEGAVPLSGHAWFDHLWGDLPGSGAGPTATDRVQLHLDDGSDLALIRTRRRDGRGLPTLDAVLVAPDGSVETRSDGEATPGGHWQGRHGRYPLDWQLRLGDLELRITPVIEDQELPFATPVWSGLVRAEGRRGGQAVTGLGTLQLTGYDTP